MDLFSSMKMYVAVVDGGSFASAATKLDISRAMVSKQIQKLEEHLGTRLLNRTTRRLSLTETGREFYERSTQIMGDVEEAEQIAGQMTRTPQGMLRVTIPLSYGQHRLASIIGEYTQSYPQVRLDISLSDRKVDLIEDGLDLAIRIGSMPQSDLIARKIGGVRSLVCATSAYLAMHGTPQTPADLKHHACLGYTLTGTGTEWRLEEANGTGTEVIPVSGPIKADNGDILRLAALHDAGILFQPHFIVADDLAAGRLVRVLPQWQSGELGVYAVYPSRRHLSAKVRTFVEFLIARLDA
ncbi:DNA-binding transcriptional regulator, LysR family [Collimonas sp. OK607]|uniref:LysR family transcriptional regulator n=1 Tax=Collimonas sp. OK607 TaxID=1798194 RepID=UPI0008DF5DF8|nr:LysR family transcriptional regulator [Collimonas sp. OK607]SFB21058.1 DNA-binding transcriptional regulator, LysR family [Collimonas sp. OK607]